MNEDSFYGEKLLETSPAKRVSQVVTSPGKKASQVLSRANKYRKTQTNSDIRIDLKDKDNFLQSKSFALPKSTANNINTSPVHPV